MAEKVVLLMLVGWLGCTLVMTVRAGRARSARARDGRTARGMEPPAGALPGGKPRDPVLVTRR